MATFRQDPYRNFNFLVQIGGNDASARGHGYYEVVLPTAEIQLTEYREGNDRDNTPRRLPGLSRTGNVTLRRGLNGSLELWEWFRATRNGQIDRRDVVVQLLSEDHADVVMAWKLRGCFPVRYVSPTLSALGRTPAIEEIELAVESIDIE